MIVRIVYKSDNTIVVIHPAPKSKEIGETEEQWLDRVFTRTMKANGYDEYDYEDVDISLLPSREYRNAWEGEKGKGITINEVKKQAIIDEKNKPTVEDRIKALENKLKET